MRDGVERTRDGREGSGTMETCAGVARTRVARSPPANSMRTVSTVGDYERCVIDALDSVRRSVSWKRSVEAVSSSSNEPGAGAPESGVAPKSNRFTRLEVRIPTSDSREAPRFPRHRRAAPRQRASGNLWLPTFHWGNDSCRLTAPNWGPT